MAQLFADVVTSPDFLADAQAWNSSSLDAAGIRYVERSQQIRVRPWSTQLVTPTTDGRVWFKANCDGLTHEGALQALQG